MHLKAGFHSYESSGQRATTKVLVLEENSETAELLRDLTTREETMIQSAHSQSEALEVLRRFQPDVVIIDLMALEVETLQLCRRMRQESDVPILVLSAVHKPELVARALDEGADDFLNKPIQGKLLLASLRKLVRRARAERKAKGGNGTHPG